ncbi:mechanosensitive ion channel family protein [Pontiella sulfatireligans]|uniref:Small-conductance mechanosensitive channel n=1 Tax=Pontiella sulfatireligans TaxID=2750658 RepID=A0A6C2UKU4_9BACT|nr:mechanosensitive ion channel domain-containing protein [Pontiella sulfatireligans]VGO19806.1 Small-conductance mechanosensitive channel [Pontiella sulfatireligans]
MDTNAVVAAVAVEETTPLMEKVQVMGMEYGAKILGALIVLFIGMWVAKMIKKGVIKLMEKRSVDPTLISFVASLLYMAMQIFVIVAALEKLNIKTTSFIAILGAAGLAIGLALQGSLANFAAGVLMIIFKPFKVGDVIDAAGSMGSVLEIGIFTTIMKTPDNKKMIVPNAAVTGGTITNINTFGTRRVDLIAGIGYGDDIDKAKAVLESIIAADERILKDPAPTIAVVELADSSVNFVVRPWTKSADYWGVYFDTTETIKKRFDAEGISIPFPQSDVHLYEHKND